MVCQAASMCQGVYNKTKISFSSVIIETANTSWSEATQQCYCGSTTRPRKYGRRNMAATTASIRRPIKRLWQPTTRRTLRKSEQTYWVVYNIYCNGAGCLFLSPLYKKHGWVGKNTYCHSPITQGHFQHQPW